MLLVQEFQSLQCQEMGEYGVPFYWTITFLSMPLSKFAIGLSQAEFCAGWTWVRCTVVMPCSEVTVLNM